LLRIHLSCINRLSVAQHPGTIFARRGARIHSPIESQPKYERRNGGMESDQREYARAKPQRQLHLPLYD